MSGSTVRSGGDGDYRMTIDPKYKELALMKRLAHAVFPFWLLLCFAKIAWLYAPVLSAPQHLKVPALVVTGGTTAAALVLWLIGRMGSRHERFWAVMAFNLVAAIGLAFHVTTRFLYHITSQERNEDIADARLASLTLIKLFPSLKTSALDVLSWMKVVEGVIDGGIFLIGLPLCGSMHMYVVQKKKVRKEVAVQKAQ